MKVFAVVLLIAAAACAVELQLAEDKVIPYGRFRTTVGADHKCRMTGPSPYPPSPDRALVWHNISLDVDPADRWTEVVTPLGKEIHAMVYEVIDLIPEKIRDEIFKVLDEKAEAIADAMPHPYGDEIKGIAKAIDMDLAALLLYNIAYELEGVCTSTVVEDSNGHIYHARNLDFGLFLGWDKANKTWLLAELLRPLLFNANVQQGGKTLYKATYFAGYVGLLTGLKQGAFSISVDTRYDENLDSGLIRWLRGNHTGAFLSFTTRDAIEKDSTFDEAFARLNNTDMVGPSYMILGGAKPGEAAVITREQDKSLHPWTLANGGGPDTKFYVIETNYDHWEAAPFFDNRRDPAMDCLTNVIGQNNVSFSSLFHMLSTQPNLNLLTTYTTLMDVQTGELEAYTQNCLPPCTPW